MRLVPVRSSNVDAVGHAGDELLVRYRSGPAVYSYGPVTAATAAALFAAPSAGRFLRRLQRDPAIRALKLSPEEAAARGVEPPEATA